MDRGRLRIMVLLPTLLTLASCGADASTTPPSGVRSALPSPSTTGGAGLHDALAGRRSVRSFTDETLTLDEVSQLLWAAQGVTADWGGRTAPSAGGLYPIEVYVADAEGVRRYVPEGHRTERISDADRRPALADAAGGQEAARDAPTLFVIAAVSGRTEEKYGERAERYVALEAGHVCQNLLLEATALGLGGVPIGAFSDDGVREALGLPETMTPLYLVPVGHPDI
jgi:SagB-type dehydrogenase family enzyme